MPVQPSLAFVVLTVRTQTMAAGMGDRLPLPAIRTLHHQDRACLGTTNGHGAQSALVTGQHPASEFLPQRILEGRYQGRQKDHTSSSRRNMNDANIR